MQEADFVVVVVAVVEGLDTAQALTTDDSLSLYQKEW